MCDVSRRSLIRWTIEMKKTTNPQALLMRVTSEITDRCSSYSFTAASPRGVAVRPCSMSLTEDGARPISAPISARVIPFARRSEMRDAQVVMRASLRDPVDRMQRHPVTAFRESMDMPKSAEIPKFDSLGARITFWRERRGWGRSELARRAKIPYSTLADIEQGRQKSSTKLHQIAAALGVNVQYLATGKGEPEIDAAPTEDFWPFPFPREDLLELDDIELELVGLKLQRFIEEVRAKRVRKRARQAS